MPVLFRSIALCGLTARPGSDVDDRVAQSHSTKHILHISSNTPCTHFRQLIPYRTVPHLTHRSPPMTIVSPLPMSIRLVLNIFCTQAAGRTRSMFVGVTSHYAGSRGRMTLVWRMVLFSLQKKKTLYVQSRWDR